MEMLLLIFPGFILAIITMVMYEIKLRKPRNNVHFYVTCEKSTITEGLSYSLWIGLPKRDDQGMWHSSIWGSILATDSTLLIYNLNHDSFGDMKDGEIREVFLNLED